MKKILVITLLFTIGYVGLGLTHTKKVVIINPLYAGNNEQISKPQVKQLNEGSYTGSNPCSLKVVNCFDEGSMASELQRDVNPDGLVADKEDVQTLGASEDKTVKHYTGNFSMYTSSVNETDSDPFTTADGTDLREQSDCVVANNNLKFGTKIRIIELGAVCTVHDRMGQKNGEDHFDIYTPNDRQYALNFGRKMLTYEILE